MFRILGFIVGSAASIALLFMLVGVPRFRAADEPEKSGRFDVVIQQLKDKQRLAAEAAEAAESAELPAGDDSAAAPPPAAPVAAAAAAVAQASEAPGVDSPPAPTATASSAGEDQPGTMPPAQPDDAELGWQPFWNPFRSEIAARGFVRRLENVTGLDYRVVKVKNGVYEVAFSYDDDDERQSKLSQIAAATGLDLSDTVQ